MIALLKMPRLVHGYGHSLIVHIKSGGVCADIGGDVEKRFGTSSYEFKRPLPMCKNKKVIGFMKDALGSKIIK